MSPHADASKRCGTADRQTGKLAPVASPHTGDPRRAEAQRRPFDAATWNERLAFVRCLPGPVRYGTLMRGESVVPAVANSSTAMHCTMNTPRGQASTYFWTSVAPILEPHSRSSSGWP